MADGLKTLGRLSELAAAQWGMFTTVQAHALRLDTAALATARIIEPARPGVYRMTAAPGSPHDLVRAAWLGIEPERTATARLADSVPAVISHRTAALLHGLGDVDSDTIDITVTTPIPVTDDAVRYHHTPAHGPEWTVVDGLPVTTMCATITDLAAIPLDGGHLASVVRDAVTHGGLTPDMVAAALAPHNHRYSQPPVSGTELLDLFLWQAGIPESVRQLAERLTARHHTGP